MTPQTPGENRGLIGATFGTYRIVAKLGEGGMGEVFRAHDSTLRRDVALKMLTAWSADDPAKEEQLARFAREARALAALNHPHIGAIYGFESHVPGDVGSTSVTALVLELVEGETLAGRIRRGPLPAGDAVRLAVQITGALAAAHEKGIVHRDLKPANIKVTPAGIVKVLDFGLAKTIIDADPTANTRSEMVSRQGTVVGTPAYMSPEQVRGQDVDTRTDVWAFGCVLYEMLTGRQAFAGSTWSDCMAAVLERDPDWSLLPSPISAETRALLRRCLQKDRTRRLRDMGDVQLVLEDTTAAAPVVATPSTASRRSPTTMALVALVAAALGGLAVWVARPTVPTPVQPTMRVEIVPSPLDPISVATTTSTLAMSRDGMRLAWASSRHADRAERWTVDRPRYWRVDALAGGRRATSARPVILTRWAMAALTDSGGPGLYKIPSAGGTPTTVLPKVDAVRGASWADDGAIVYATSNPETGLLRVSDSGGTITVLTKPNPDHREADHVLPSVLPNGRGVLFTILDAAADNPRVAVLDTRAQSQKVLIPGAASAHYLDAGYLVYVAAGTIFAVGFDVEKLEVQGEPVTLATGVLMGSTVGATMPFRGPARWRMSRHRRRPMRRAHSCGSIATASKRRWAPRRERIRALRWRLTASASPWPSTTNSATCGRGICNGRRSLASRPILLLTGYPPGHLTASTSCSRDAKAQQATCTANQPTEQEWPSA